VASVHSIADLAPKEDALIGYVRVLSARRAGALSVCLFTGCTRLLNTESV